jgi:hypothetical protein
MILKWVRSDYISIHGELAYRQVAPETTDRCLHEAAVLWYSRRSYEAHTRPGPITTAPRASNRQTSPVAKISRPVSWSEKVMFKVFCGLSGGEQWCPLPDMRLLYAVRHVLLAVRSIHRALLTLSVASESLSSWRKGYNDWNVPLMTKWTKLWKNGKEKRISLL